MIVYKEFSDFYRKELYELNGSLSKLQKMSEISNIKKEICKSDTDYRIVYNEFKSINENQTGAIFNLNSLCVYCEIALAAL